MKLRIPSYYQQFSCIADKCKDSCCIGWEIDIDEDTFSYYEGIQGSFGEQLKQNMVTDDVSHFTLKENGWCPFLNQKKLCDICIELGEEALSEVCTEYPRFTMEYEDIREKALCLSCEEVGRILFSQKDKVEILEMEIPEESYEEEYEDEIDSAEEEAYEKYARNLEISRDVAIEILQDRSQPIRDRICQYLNFCSEVQKLILAEKFQESRWEKKALYSYWKKDKGAVETFSYEAFQSRMMILEELDVLDEEWANEKKKLTSFFEGKNYEKMHQLFLAETAEREVEYEQLLVYDTFRYFMKAYYDFNVLTKAQFAVMSYLTIRDMSVERYAANGEAPFFSLEDQIDVARIYSKEVEHSEENMEQLAEAFEFDDIFEPEQLVKEI